MTPPPSDDLIRITLICVGVAFGGLGFFAAGNGAWQIVSTGNAVATGFAENCALVIGWLLGIILSGGFAAAGVLAVAMLPIGLWKLVTYLTKRRKIFRRRQKLSR